MVWNGMKKGVTEWKKEKEREREDENRAWTNKKFYERPA